MQKRFPQNGTLGWLGVPSESRGRRDRLSIGITAAGHGSSVSDTRPAVQVILNFGKLARRAGIGSLDRRRRSVAELAIRRPARQVFDW
jgi:hypothetical protein